MSSQPRHALLVVFGQSQYDSINALNREVMRILPQLGIDPVAISLASAERFNADMGNALRDYTPERIIAAFSFSGFGIEIGDNAPEGNLWQRLGIPFLTWMLDHPAYHLRRHKHTSPAVMRLYPNRDFLDYHRDYVHTPFRTAYCPFGVLTYGHAPQPRQPKAGEQPLILFPKSVNDPTALEKTWLQLPRLMQRVLREAVDHYWGATPRSGTVTPSVMAAADAAGIELRDDLALQSFFIAQLDDYIRRRKADHLARELLRLPVTIYGDGLDYLDKAGARAAVLPSLAFDDLSAEFRKALAIVNMNQNIDDEMHDRPYAALGCGALPITDINPWWESRYPALMPYSYDFRERSVTAAVEKTLADPVAAAEVAWKMAQRAQTGRSFEQAVAEMVEFAAMHRYFSLNFATPLTAYTKPKE